MESQSQEGHNDGFLAGSVLDAFMPPWNAGEGDGDEFKSLRAEKEVEADRSARRKWR